MAITLPNGFIITNQQPVDSRLVLTKAEMAAALDAKMPSNYLCVCKDDGKIYIYNYNNVKDSATGKFRLFEGGKNYTAGNNVQISDQNVISATDTKYTAGTNITIDSNNVISATGASEAEYIELEGWDESSGWHDGGTITDAQAQILLSSELNYIWMNDMHRLDFRYKDENNNLATYSANDGTKTHVIEITLSTKAWRYSHTQLQVKLTAGNNVQISDSNVISATDTKYTAGTNITIDANNVISATGGSSYIAGNGIDINTDTNTISTKLSNGLKYTDDGKLTLNTDSTIRVDEFGARVPYVSTSLDNTLNGLAVKIADDTIEAYNSGTGTKGIRVNQNVIQPKLTVGDNISITNNIISAIDTKIATQITLGQSITAQAAIGGIPAGKVYAATDTLATLLTDLLGGTGPAPTGTKLYYGVSADVPSDVSGMTAIDASAATLIESGYTWKNISANNEYVSLAIDKTMGIDCYEILQNGFAIGFNRIELTNQILYVLTDKVTDTGMRLVYHFEEA